MRVHRSAIDLSPQLSSVALPGCKRTFQLTRHSTATSTYRLDVHQVANGVATQAIFTTDGLTSFGETTTSRPLFSGGVQSVVITTGWRYGLYRLRAHCTNVVQLWTQVKSEFEPSSAIKCVAPKWFKCWSPFNSQLPSDHRSNRQ